jgi:hypothetical protein
MLMSVIATWRMSFFIPGIKALHYLANLGA